MKILALLALFCSACITRTVTAPATTPAPVAAPKAEPPTPQSLYHHAEDIFLKSKLGQGATCVRERATPDADSATCTTPQGVTVAVWDSAVAGFGMHALVVPEQAKEQPPSEVTGKTTPAKVEAPKKK